MVPWLIPKNPTGASVLSLMVILDTVYRLPSNVPEKVALEVPNGTQRTPYRETLFINSMLSDVYVD